MNEREIHRADGKQQKDIVDLNYILSRINRQTLVD